MENKVPRVKHVKERREQNDVFIGRPTKWGNPFHIGKDGGRGEVIGKYIRHMKDHPKLCAEARAELKDKNLVCFCFPRPCHGDVLLRIVKGEEL